MLSYPSLGVGGEANVGFEGVVRIEGAEEIAVEVLVGGIVVGWFCFDGGGNGGITADAVAIGGCFRGNFFSVVPPLSRLWLALLCWTLRFF